MMRQQSKQQKMAVDDSNDVAAIGDTGNDSAGVAYGIIRRDNTVISNTVTDSDGLIRPSRRQRRVLPAEIH